MTKDEELIERGRKWQREMERTVTELMATGRPGFAEVIAGSREVGKALKDLADRLEALARPVVGEKALEALQWYADQVAGCRKLGSIGEPHRNNLDEDGGKRARAALAASPSPVVPQGEGWVYSSPDAGLEYARQHPIESGETPDATNIRRSTEMEDAFHDRINELDAARFVAPVVGEEGRREQIARIIVDNCGGAMMLLPKQAKKAAEMIDAILSSTPVMSVSDERAALEKIANWAMPEYGWYGGQAVDMQKVARAALSTPVTEAGQERCEYCGDTGDVHRSDGEWLGECTCGRAMPVSKA